MNTYTNIYRLSGLEPGNNSTKYYLFDTNGLSNTQAENLLISKINLLSIKIETSCTGVTASDLMNELDILLIAYFAYKYEKDITNIGSIVQAMIEDQLFVSGNTNNDFRSDNLEKLKSSYIKYSDCKKYYKGGYFSNFWEDEIIPINYNDGNSNIGLFGANESIEQKIADAGNYYIYLFIPENELNKYPEIVRKKRDKELEMFGWLCDQATGIYTPDAIWNMIYFGTISSTQKEPLDFIEDVKKISKANIGIAAEAIIALVGAIIGLIMAIISAVVQVWQIKRETPENPEYGALSLSDFNDNYGNENNSSSNTKTKILIAIAAVGSFLFLKRN